MEGQEGSLACSNLQHTWSDVSLLEISSPGPPATQLRYQLCTPRFGEGQSPEYKSEADSHSWTVLVSHQAVLRAYDWLSTQESLLTMLGHPYGLAGIKPGSVPCMASAVLSPLLLAPELLDLSLGKQKAPSSTEDIRVQGMPGKEG